ncbi:MAG TPA: tRNA preQ1(34) S-adenosylmethionine ribosyltransferase-isomerase QueA [Firmicutes bacterium]|nr:tRNA preQ1(34) S-adenosylmethionine ribosyltransferase-isomerase QueA [Bacillota bacterium]
MRLEDFAYYLPPDCIAQEPVEPRDASRLLVLHREDGRMEHRHFRDLPAYLRRGDVLVLNDSRVLPARLYLRRADTGGRAEVLLLHSVGAPIRPTEDPARAVGDPVPPTGAESAQEWKVLGRPARRLRPGVRLVSANGLLEVEVLQEEPEGVRRVVLRWPAERSLPDLLEQLGQLPLPPYIHRPLADRERYQTVYSRDPGSAAAPTAGLHFTPRLLRQLVEEGVELCYLTLHVGLGTFRPLREETVEEAHLHAEYYRVEPRVAASVAAARRRGGRVVAVGTTVVRGLESVGQADGTVQPGQGWTDLFIYPGFRFQVVDALVTNFHLPRSSLLLLVSAFAGRERITNAYQEALREGYRFYSFGDAMLIL